LPAGSFAIGRAAANQRLASLHAASHGEAFHVGSACITEAELVATEFAPFR